MALVPLFENIKKPSTFWSHINIREDLELQTIDPNTKDPKAKMKSGNCDGYHPIEHIVWIRDKRRNKGLEVQLEPLVVKFPTE